ncbi:MAG: NADP-dependent oxidoreductase [Chromatiales bacterium]|jgi:NADPH-dependent curcumin reductase|nr:NADP-dependent oxidoreductase [Chromatiales bacterium]
MNQVWRLARTPPDGSPSIGDFSWSAETLPSPADGQMSTRTIYLSLDPYQWGRRRSGLESPGEVCHGRTVSQVIASRLSGFEEGDYVFNTNGWQTHGLSGADVSIFGYMHPRKIDPAIAPISTAVGIVGMLGLTAYAGLLVQCNPQAGETVVVSAASGGVGQVVGQLAKIRGCRVVGIAGAPHKCAHVTQELGFDACVSHLSDTPAEDLAAACPDGIDAYFENVGGKVFEAVLPLLNQGARISRCGLISQYFNTDGRDTAEVWLETGKPYFDRCNASVHGLRVRDYVEQYQDQCFDEMAGWIKDGKVKYREDLWDGLEKAPEAFIAMLGGRNFGKTLVGVSADPTLDAATSASRSAGNTLG